MPPRGPRGQSINTVPPRPNRPRVPRPKATGSTLMVRNLPLDVKPADVTELFQVTIGPLAKPVEMFFDDRGNFSGTALVFFRDGEDAAKAWESFNGKLIDGKTEMHLSLVYSSPPAAAAPAPVQPPVVQLAPQISKLGELKPFPAQQQQRKAKPPAAKKAPLKARLGPAVIPLASRLGQVVGENGGQAQKIVVGGAANLKKKKAGAGKKKRSSLAKATRMDVD